jgi:hypothetical protein
MKKLILFLALTSVQIFSCEKCAFGYLQELNAIDTVRKELEPKDDVYTKETLMKASMAKGYEEGLHKAIEMILKHHEGGLINLKTKASTK